MREAGFSLFTAMHPDNFFNAFFRCERFRRDERPFAEDFLLHPKMLIGKPSYLGEMRDANHL